MDPNEFAAKFSQFMEFLNSRAVEHHKAHWPGSTRNPDTFDFEPGRKYVRIFRRDENGASRSCYCFVGMEDGKIWKSAGWYAPALNFPRGNIFDTMAAWEKLPYYGL